MEARISLVDFLICGGPEWQKGHDYVGEVLTFTIMKQMQFCAEADKVADSLVKPETMRVQVEKFCQAWIKWEIWGAIVDDVCSGTAREGVPDDLGLSFLKKGVKIKLWYRAQDHSGRLSFYDLGDGDIFLYQQDEILHAMGELGAYYLEVLNYGMVWPGEILQPGSKPLWKIESAIQPSPMDEGMPWYDCWNGQCMGGRLPIPTLVTVLN